MLIIVISIVTVLTAGLPSVKKKYKQLLKNRLSTRKVNTKNRDMKGIFLWTFLWEKHANYFSVLPLVRCSYIVPAVLLTPFGALCLFIAVFKQQ